MPIQVYDKDNQLLAEGDTSASAEIKSIRNVMVYVIYTQGSESGLNLKFYVKNTVANAWFPVQYDNGTAIIPYERTLTSGKYRIVIPIAENEDFFRIEAALVGGSGGQAQIWLIPQFYQY